MTAKVDDSEVLAILGRVRMTRKNMIDIADPGAITIINHQKSDVPVDTAATKLSINKEIVTATQDLVTEIIGPTTEYAPSIEFGITSKPNYPIQPFVRPSVFGSNGRRAVNVIKRAFTDTFLVKIKRSAGRSSG